MARDDQNRISLGVETDTRKNYHRKLGAREAKLAEAIIYNENIDDDFSSALVVSNFDTDGTIYTGAADEQVAFHSGRAAYEYHVESVATGAAVIAPYQSASGLELKVMAGGTGPDQIEITNGTTALSPAAYTTGSFASADSTLYCEFTVKFDDISSVTEFWCGFRSVETYAAPAAYNDCACFNVGEDTDGQVEIQTILATTEVDTDTTEADVVDGGEHTFRIEVKNNGACKFYYDGSEPTVTQSFSFASGTNLIPFVALDSETGDPGVSISKWQVGYM